MTEIRIKTYGECNAGNGADSPGVDDGVCGRNVEVEMTQYRETITCGLCDKVFETEIQWQQHMATMHWYLKEIVG